MHLQLQESKVLLVLAASQNVLKRIKDIPATLHLTASSGQKTIGRTGGMMLLTSSIPVCAGPEQWQ